MDSSSVSIYDSTQRSHPAIEELQEVFHFRHLILQLVRRDVLTRYKRSFLGIAWTMLNPLGMMLVWTIAFSQVFDRGGGGWVCCLYVKRFVGLALFFANYHCLDGQFYMGRWIVASYLHAAYIICSGCLWHRID